MSAPANSEANSRSECARFTFVLLPRFTLPAFAGAADCLRLANRIAGRSLYEWRLVSEHGTPVASSLGLEMGVDEGLGETRSGETVLLCGGLDIEQAAGPALLAWLRRQARRGARLGGLCTAAHVLASAGLLEGRRTTIHWENQDSFAERFPDVQLARTVFTIDGPRLSAAGGIASIDLMLQLIAEDHGQALAAEVADQLLYNAIRTDQDRQRISVPARIGIRHPKLARVIEMMEENLEEPLPPSRLAAMVQLSTRQLERLFRRYLERSPKRYYMELRLQKARNLLMQTDMSVINVALACGFTSPSHFSKCYRMHYGVTPYRERGTRAPGSAG